MAEHRDAATKSPLGEGALERRYLDYLDAGHPPVSFDAWLAGEIAERFIERWSTADYRE